MKRNAVPSDEFATWFLRVFGVAFPLPQLAETFCQANSELWADRPIDADAVEGFPHHFRVPSAVRYRLCAYDGHGINSWAAYYTVARPGRRVYLRLPFGGAYGDHQRDSQRKSKRLRPSLVEYRCSRRGAMEPAPWTSRSSRTWGRRSRRSVEEKARRRWRGAGPCRPFGVASSVRFQATSRSDDLTSWPGLTPATEADKRATVPPIRDTCSTSRTASSARRPPVANSPTAAGSSPAVRATPTSSNSSAQPDFLKRLATSFE